MEPQTERNPEYEPIWRVLCATIQRAGVHFEPSHVSFSQNGSDAYYSPDPWTPGELEPRIEVFRQVSSEIVDDYKAETITLAHEYGHHLSYMSGDRPDKYAEVTNRFNSQGAQRADLSEPECRMLYDEEVRAWRYGLAILDEHGFTDMDAASERRDHDLCVYRERLGLKDDGLMVE